jgi:ATP-binding cassette subfamily B (MDR/TAP) protein 1
LIQISYLGLGALFVGWGMFSLWMTAGVRQTTECRKFYMQSLIKQDIEWFDLQKQSELASQFAIDCQAFQSAVGEKVSTIIMVLSMLISGLVIAFSKGWLLALIILATMPIVFFGWYLVIRISTKKNKV